MNKTKTIGSLGPGTQTEEKIIEENCGNQSIIAKIENRQGVDKLEEIYKRKTVTDSISYSRKNYR